jgi:hypothetical protein
MKITIEVDIPQGRSVAEAEAAVKQHFDPDWMASWWHIDDVKGQADGWEESTEDSLTDDEAREVLRLVDKYHNCEVGICWDVIDGWIDEVKSKRKESA